MPPRWATRAADAVLRRGRPGAAVGAVAGAARLRRVGDTTVTIMATEGPRQVANHLNEEPAAVLAHVRRGDHPGGDVLGRQGRAGHRRDGARARAGGARVAQEAVRAWLVDAWRVTPEQLEAAGVVVERAHSSTRSRWTPTARCRRSRSIEDLFLVTAGGEGSGWSAYLPSAAPTHHTRHATRRVRLPGEALPDCGPDSCEVHGPRDGLPAGRRRAGRGPARAPRGRALDGAGSC